MRARFACSLTPRGALPVAVAALTLMAGAYLSVAPARAQIMIGIGGGGGGGIGFGVPTPNPGYSAQPSDATPKQPTRKAKSDRPRKEAKTKSGEDSGSRRPGVDETTFGR